MSIEEGYKALAATETMKSVALTMDGVSGVPVFSLPPGWNVGLKDKDEQEITEVTLHYKDVDYSLSKEAVLSIAHAVGLPPAYVARTPGVLIATHLNYWATHSPDTTLKLLTKDDTVLAVTKQGIVPFSNVEILERAVDALCDTYGWQPEDLRLDDKTYHSLHSTGLRIVTPDQRIVEGDDWGDTWEGGVQILNSLTGKHAVSINAFMQNVGVESGVVMQHSAGRYNRKIMGQGEDDFLPWVSSTVKEIADSFKHETEVLQSASEESVQDAASQVLADIFRSYKVPLKVRQSIINTFTEREDYTGYGVVLSIIEAANAPDLPHHFVTAIMEIGGAVANDMHHRCQSCKRVMV
jgi:hypothetical protein